MVAGDAVRIRSTLPSIQAWVHALSVDAHLVHRTFVVAIASFGHATSCAITFHSSGTTACGFVVSGYAFGIRRARVSNKTRVGTITIVTCLGGRTVLIGFASRCKRTQDEGQQLRHKGEKDWHGNGKGLTFFTGYQRVAVIAGFTAT